MRSVTFEVDDVMFDWLGQKAYDVNTSVGDLARRGVARQMFASPTTTNAALNEKVADYLEARA